MAEQLLKRSRGAARHPPQRRARQAAQALDAWGAVLLFGEQAGLPMQPRRAQGEVERREVINQKPAGLYKARPRVGPVFLAPIKYGTGCSVVTHVTPLGLGL